MRILTDVDPVEICRIYTLLHEAHTRMPVYTCVLIAIIVFVCQEIGRVEKAPA